MHNNCTSQWSCKCVALYSCCYTIFIIFPSLPEIPSVPDLVIPCSLSFSASRHHWFLPAPSLVYSSSQTLLGEPQGVLRTPCSWCRHAAEVLWRFVGTGADTREKSCPPLRSCESSPFILWVLLLAHSHGFSPVASLLLHLFALICLLGST